MESELRDMGTIEKLTKDRTVWRSWVSEIKSVVFIRSCMEPYSFFFNQRSSLGPMLCLCVLVQGVGLQNLL